MCNSNVEQDKSNFEELKAQDHSIPFLKFEDAQGYLGDYQAIITMPNSVALRLFAELYGMNIPILVPTPKFYQQKSNSSDSEFVRERISKFDFYNWPHVIQFDSWKDLITKLNSMDLLKVRQLMKKHNEESNREILKRWKEGMLEFESL